MSVDKVLAATLILAAMGYLFLGLRLFASRRETGSIPIGATFIVIAILVVGGAIELLASSFTLFSIGRTGHFVGTAVIPVAAFSCFREYVGKRSPPVFIVLLSIIPFVSIALAATNSSHQLMWSLPIANAAGEFLTRPIAWGPWFTYVHAPYSYLLVSFALLSLLIHSQAVAPVHRRGLLALVATCMIPLTVTMAYDLGIGPQTLSIVPLAFTAVLPVFLWLTVGGKIFEFVPLAYETVFQNMLDPVVVVDQNQRIIGLNRGAEEMLSMSETEALRAPLDAVFGAGSSCVFEALQSGSAQRMVTDTGRFLHVQVSPIDHSAKGLTGGKVLMFRDVSDFEKAQEEVRQSEMLLRTLVDHSVNGIVRLRWVEDLTGATKLTSIFANAAAGRFLDRSADGLLNRDAHSIIRLASSGMTEKEVFPVLHEFQTAVEAGIGVDTEVRQGSGASARWLRMICEPVGEDIAVTFIDVTDSKAKQHKAESIASSDPLTGVLNRRGFEHEAAERMRQSADDAEGALFFIDLNDFKLINDEHGHEAGDQLLVIAAKRLQQSLRSCDIIGRPGGDEFVALVPDVSKYKAGKLASRLATSLQELYQIGGRTLKCSASIGLAHYPDNANTLTGLMREADQAMYRAKARSRDMCELGITSLLEKAI